MQQIMNEFLRTAWGIKQFKKEIQVIRSTENRRCKRKMTSKLEHYFITHRWKQVAPSATHRLVEYDFSSWKVLLSTHPPSLMGSYVHKHVCACVCVYAYAQAARCLYLVGNPSKLIIISKHDRVDKMSCAPPGLLSDRRPYLRWWTDVALAWT